MTDRPSVPRSWITRTVVGIVLATFLSDFGHEMATAVLPLYFGALALGPAALGLMEGLADFLVSISKLAGGLVGHHTRHKRPWASLGYAVTAVATAAMGVVTSVAALISLRGVAWTGRGFRGPLRDAVLAEAVPSSHFGRAYGLERAGDMLGAVAGPLAAGLFLWAGWSFSTILVWTIVPGLLAAGSFFFLTTEPGTLERSVDRDHVPGPSPRFPPAFWLLLVGVLLFGLGDFSRTFLIWLLAQHMEQDHVGLAGLADAPLLYALHNVVSAIAALAVGHAADRRSRLAVLIAGYGLGVLTNLLLAVAAGSLSSLVVVLVLSGTYIAVEETVEKAVVAELLPVRLRSLGFGILACANAVGDLMSSLYVGVLLEGRSAASAFGIAAACGVAGVLWLLLMRRRMMLDPTQIANA